MGMLAMRILTSSGKIYLDYIVNKVAYSISLYFGRNGQKFYGQSFTQKLQINIYLNSMEESFRVV
jgi:hypothetical protein